MAGARAAAAARAANYLAFEHRAGELRCASYRAAVGRRHSADVRLESIRAAGHGEYSKQQRTDASQSALLLSSLLLLLLGLYDRLDLCSPLCC